jgi:hypothetical protein
MSIPGEEAGLLRPAPPAVHAALKRLLEGAQEALGSRFLGLYLHGSLTNGDFRPARSDIDFVVAVTEEISEEMRAALEAMHARLAACGLKWAKRWEGSYIPRDALRRHDPARCRFPAVRVDGSFGIDRHGSEWIIQRHVLREQGIALAGPSPKTLIDPLTPDALRQAARAALEEWWRPMLADPARLRSREYQAYAALTMCRALYTIQCGAVVSKSAAARWAQETQGERWSALLERALDWPQGSQPDALAETREWIEYVLRTEG